MKVEVKNEVRNMTAAPAKKGFRNKFFISAGHRGRGTGASGNGIDEGAEAIVLRNEVSAVLRGMGYEVVNDADNATLSAVVKAINMAQKPDDVSLDIHFNAAGSTATGVECFVREGARVMEKVIAIELCQALSSVMGIRNRGVKSDSMGQHSRLAMCSDIRCSAILLEVCFLSSTGDVSKYRAHKMEVVRAIADVLAKRRS